MNQLYGLCVRDRQSICHQAELPNTPGFGLTSDIHVTHFNGSEVHFPTLVLLMASVLQGSGRDISKCTTETVSLSVLAMLGAEGARLGLCGCG